jgi:hypothetical protein
MSAAAVVAIPAVVNPFLRFRPAEVQRLGRAPALVMDALEFKAQRDGSTFHITSRWLEFKTGYGDRSVSRALDRLVETKRITAKLSGRGLWITVIPQAKPDAKMADQIRQNVGSEAAPSINLPEQEKPEENSNSTPAAAAEPQAEKQNPKITEMPDPQAVVELTQRKVWPAQARKLTREWGKDRVLDAVAYFEQAPGVKDPPAFLVAAIREGWKLPEAAPLPAMSKCVCCGEYFDSALEGSYGGKCLQCAEVNEKQEPSRPMADTIRPDESRRRTVPDTSPGTDQRTRIVRMGPRISTPGQKEQELRRDSQSVPQRMETQTPGALNRGFSSAREMLSVPCLKCGLQIKPGDGLGGMHFACDEGSRG